VFLMQSAGTSTSTSTSTSSTIRGLTTQQADLDLLTLAASDIITPSYKETTPVIHTFFNSIGNTKGHKKDPMVETWEHGWQEAGFRTKVLTLQDAMKHPYFETMKIEVEKVFPKDEYNRLCFYRYLAMAIEGGIMSDYDTFPTNYPLDEALELPNGGAFTSYQAHVPSLISASAKEWERVAILMTKHLPKTRKSDMYTLKELGNEGGHDLIFLLPSYNVHTFLPYKSKGVINCKEAANFRAVHVSHFATGEFVRSGFSSSEEVEGLDKDAKRAKFAEIFLRDWKEQCGGNKYLKED